MKKEPLTKNDLCWVLVKLLGAVLVYQAVAGVYAAVVMWMSFDEGVGEVAFMTARVLFWSILLPAIFGISLLISGRFLHGWLMMVPLEATGKPVGGDSLAERRLAKEEFEKYQEWLEANPEMMKRDEVDRLALFRDAQKAGEV